MGIKNFFKRFIQEEEGATAVEYAIMVALIAAVIVGAVTMIGTNINSKFTNVSEIVKLPG
jgi:pilus assembly protein Flp/PilA